ncbi:cytochrome P450 [Astrocystis sublimbata]|nr:cytochrome P450 [Astrocystis sublimbata]
MRKMMEYIRRSDGSSPTLAILFIAWLIFYAVRVIYRLWFHPLAKFPGPRLAAATSLYEAYYELVYKRGAHFAPHVRQLHKLHGPIVRISPDEISINDAEFHDKLYAPQPAVRDRHPNFSAFLGTTKGSFSTPGHQLHRHRRGAYAQFFSWSNVMASESLALKKIHHLCDILSSNRDQNPNFRTYFAALSFDSFFTWAFGSSLELLDNLDLASQCNETVELLVTTPPVYRIFPSAMYLARKLPRVILRRLSRHIDRIFDLEKLVIRSAQQFVAEQSTSSSNPLLAQDVKQTQSPETLFSVISRSQAPEEEKAPVRMAQEGLEMFMASFTPGRTMTLGMYYILSHPQVLRRLRLELDSVNPEPSQDLSYQQLNNIPYLRAVMKEILRITFPVGARLPMICHEDIEYRDWTVPAYTSISVNHRTLLLDTDVFPRPLQFEPERWIENPHTIDEKRHFVAFGKGARSCPGKDFATNLVQLTLATLIQRFDFEIIDTIWERDVLVSRESTLTAPAAGSEGVKLKLVGPRRVEQV